MGYIYYLDGEEFPYYKGCYIIENACDVRVGDIIQYKVNRFGGLWEDKESFCKIHYSIFFKVESITEEEHDEGYFERKYMKVTLSLHHKSPKAIVTRNGTRQQRTVYLQANGNYGVKKCS